MFGSVTGDSFGSRGTISLPDAGSVTCGGGFSKLFFGESSSARWGLL